MELSTTIGLCLSAGLLLLAVLLGGGSVTSFLHLPSLICVGGGVAAATLMSFPFATLTRTFRNLPRMILASPRQPRQISAQLVAFAAVARREGLLALEPKLAELDDSFVVTGLQLVIDRAKAEEIEQMLRAEMESRIAHNRDAKLLLETMGKYAPAFGMIGTLMGLVVMLGNLHDSASVGSGMAVAILTTLYGAVAANCVFLPLADKLQRLGRAERNCMEAGFHGVLAIRAGEHPRIIEQKLDTFLPLEERGVVLAA